MPLIGIDQDSAIIDFAYLFAGLVAIIQSCLVHRMLQGVEHTDPTGWSIHTVSLETNSYWLFNEQPAFSRVVYYFSFQRKFSHSRDNGSATSHIV